ncbi:MAG: monovalent cation/H(+) antiporter subunit G [Blautia sp.]|nr:monovalent cation/H(+) antiporter subunit G [Blautia sp.]
MKDWIIFGVTAFFLLAAMICYTTAVIGAYRFGFVMNRMHAAGIGDSLGLLSVIISTVVATGFRLDALKLILLILFMWFTSPASSHFLGQVEYYTNPHLFRHVDRLTETEDKTGQQEE